MSTVEKFAEISDVLTAIEEFLEWCANKGIQLGEYSHLGNMYPILQGRRELLLEYFEIDPVALEAERRELLAAL